MVLTKIYASVNYIYVEFDDATQANDKKADVRVTQNGIDSDSFTISSPMIGVHNVVGSTTLDENVVAYGTIAAFKTFADTNTGNFNSDAGGSASSLDIGFVDYNDAATAVTPIAFTSGVPVLLTNDKLGPFTNESYLPAGVTSIFVSNQFDWSELSLGDMVDIRIDIDVITGSQNQNVRVDMILAEGDAGEYVINFADVFQKTAGQHKITEYNGVYMGDPITFSNPAEFRLTSDGTGTAIVNGWYCVVTKRNLT
jgi:hypothetical protein